MLYRAVAESALGLLTACLSRHGGHQELHAIAELLDEVVEYLVLEL
jgi:hypothetical protein